MYLPLDPPYPILTRCETPPTVTLSSLLDVLSCNLFEGSFPSNTEAGLFLLEEGCAKPTGTCAKPEAGRDDWGL